MNLYSSFCKWGCEEWSAEEGVLVGCDLSQEWLLPWWWEQFQKTNRLPVAFVDFGLSEPMKRWCRERGIFIPLRMADIFVAEKERVEAGLVQEWEEGYGKQFWENRNAWFKKPMACLKTPFRKSVWLDLDCEVLGSLEGIFSFCEHLSGVAIAEENHSSGKRGGVNSGVIVFKHGVPLFEAWARDALEQNHLYPGDQDILTVLIGDFVDLPPIYNWSRCNGENPDALILHWHGRHGKTILRHRIAKEQSEIL